MANEETFLQDKPECGSSTAPEGAWLPPQRTVVVAGNYQQFKAYCRKYGVDPGGVIYAADGYRVYGVHNPRVVLTGAYAESPAYLAVIDRGWLKEAVEAPL
jgi:hypothetical protein